MQQDVDRGGDIAYRVTHRGRNPLQAADSRCGTPLLDGGRRDTVESWNEMGSAGVAGNVIACAVCLPLALPVLESGPVDWVVVAYLGVFQIGLAYLLLTRGVRHVPALEASLLLLLEPVLNAIFAWLLLGERPASWSLAGCAVIFGTTVALTLRRRT